MLALPLLRRKKKNVVTYLLLRTLEKYIRVFCNLKKTVLIHTGFLVDLRSPIRRFLAVFSLFSPVLFDRDVVGAIQVRFSIVLKLKFASIPLRWFRWLKDRLFAYFSASFSLSTAIRRNESQVFWEKGKESGFAKWEGPFRRHVRSNAK